MNRSSIFPYCSKFSSPCAQHIALTLSLSYTSRAQKFYTLHTPRFNWNCISVQYPLSSSSLLLCRVYYCIMQSCQTLLSLRLTNPSSWSSWLLRKALSSKTRHITHPRTIPSTHQVDCCIMPCCHVWFVMMLSCPTSVPMSYNASSSHFIFV